MVRQDGQPIGVIDSGLVGLTVVRELRRLLPLERIAYFGDNANCPYGNRPREEILELSMAMLDFLGKKGIKIAAIACNTISALAGELRERYNFPIVSIIEAACEYTAGLGLSQAGIFATNFTISCGLYENLLRRQRPEIKAYGIPSPTLAALVDEGQFDSPAAREEARRLIAMLREKHPEARHAILGCTHYPIVIDLFEAEAPDIAFINPAEAQAKAVQSLLKKNGLLEGEPPEGGGQPYGTGKAPILEIYTSGETRQYDAALKKLNISRPLSVFVI